MATNHPDAMENNKNQYKSALENITFCLIKVDEIVKRGFKEVVGDFLSNNQMKQLKDLQSDLNKMKSELEAGIRINTQIFFLLEELRDIHLAQAEALDIRELGPYPEFNSDFSFLLLNYKVILTENQQTGIAGVATGTAVAIPGLAYIGVSGIKTLGVVSGIKTLGVAACTPGGVVSGIKTLGVAACTPGGVVLASAVAGGFAAAWLYKAHCIGKERKVKFEHLIQFKDILDAKDKQILNILISTNSFNENVIQGLQNHKIANHQQQAQVNNSKLKNICKSYKNTYKMTKNSLIEEGLAEDRAKELARKIARASVKNLLTPVITIEEVEDIVLD